MKRIIAVISVFALLVATSSTAFAVLPPPRPTQLDAIQAMIAALTTQLSSLTTKVNTLQFSVDSLKPGPPKTTTSLLLPFATNQAGFDTGLTIANTGDGSGSCTINFFGSNAPPPVNTGNIAQGTVYTTLASTAAPGFQGYIIFECSFPRARGWGFVSDLGARNLAASVDAEVLP